MTRRRMALVLVAALTLTVALFGPTRWLWRYTLGIHDDAPQTVDVLMPPRLLAVDKIYHLDGTQPVVAMFFDDGHVYTASPHVLATWTLQAHVAPDQEMP